MQNEPADFFSAGNIHIPVINFFCQCTGNVAHSQFLVPHYTVNDGVIPTEAKNLIRWYRIQHIGERIDRFFGGDDMCPRHICNNIGQHFCHSNDLTGPRIANVEDIKRYMWIIEDQSCQMCGSGVLNGIVVALEHACMHLHEKVFTVSILHDLAHDVVLQTFGECNAIITLHVRHIIADSIIRLLRFVFGNTVEFKRAFIGKGAFQTDIASLAQEIVHISDAHFNVRIQIPYGNSSFLLTLIDLQSILRADKAVHAEHWSKVVKIKGISFDLLDASDLRV